MYLHKLFPVVLILCSVKYLKSDLFFPLSRKFSLYKYFYYYPYPTYFPKFSNPPPTTPTVTQPPDSRECPLFRLKTFPVEFGFYGITYLTLFRNWIPAELKNSVKFHLNPVVLNSAGHSTWFPPPPTPTIIPLTLSPLFSLRIYLLNEYYCTPVHTYIHSYIS